MIVSARAEGIFVLSTRDGGPEGPYTMQATMKTTRILIATALLAAATGTQAQMRVEGHRPVDPRLKQPRIENAGKLPPRVEASEVETVAGGAAVTTNATQAQSSAAPVRNAAGRSGSQQPAGPLQRPSYLQPDEQAAPSGGPSSLDLMKQCFDGSISGSITSPSCVGYMAGYVGAVRISAGIGGDYPICLPESGLSNESIVSDVSAYLEENPAALQKSARSVVFLVLSQRYPCKDK